jgi:DNA-binding CsgD family transcriptional regulator/PAS domain-containing protein
MEDVAKATGSFGAALFPKEGPLPYLPISASLGKAFERYEGGGWIDRDLRYRGWSVLERSRVITDADFITEAEIKRHDYYQDFLAPCGLQDFAGVRIGTGTTLACLSIQRTFQQGAFQPAELQALRRLASQLDSVAATAQALSFARGEAAMTSFEMSGHAAILLGRKGDVVQVNAAAEALLGSDITISNRRLTSCHRDANANFEAAIKALIWNAEATTARPIALPRPGRSPLLAYCMRIPKLTDTPFSPFNAIVVLVDPDARSRPAAQTLQSGFGLTPAEARLAIALAAGADLKSEADRLGIAPGTVRKQLKSIFAKTGSRRQSELVAMLSRLLSEC